MAARGGRVKRAGRPEALADAGSATGGVGRGAECRRAALSARLLPVRPRPLCLIVARCRSPPGSRGCCAPTRGGAPARQRRQRGVLLVVARAGAKLRGRPRSSADHDGRRTDLDAPRRKAARAATVKRGAVRERPYSVSITESASPSRPQASRSSSASRDRDRRHGRSAPGPPGCRGRAGSRPDILLMQEMEPSGRLRLDHLQVARVATGSLHRCGAAASPAANLGPSTAIVPPGEPFSPTWGRPLTTFVPSAGGAVSPPTGAGAASAEDQQRRRLDVPSRRRTRCVGCPALLVSDVGFTEIASPVAMLSRLSWLANVRTVVAPAPPP